MPSSLGSLHNTATKSTRKAPGQVSERSKPLLSHTRSTNNVPRTPIQLENFSDARSETSFTPSDHKELSDAGSSPEEILSPPTRSFNVVHNPFSAEKLSMICETVQSSIRMALTHTTLGNVQQQLPVPPTVHPLDRAVACSHHYDAETESPNR